MNDLINIMTHLQKLVNSADIQIQEDGEYIRFSSALGRAFLRLMRLYRPSSQEIEIATSPDVLFVLTSPSQKALDVAANADYLIPSTGACRIVSSGVAIISSSSVNPVKAARQVKLIGRTGVIAETLRKVFHGPISHGRSQENSPRKLSLQAHSIGLLTTYFLQHPFRSIYEERTIDV